VFDMVRTYGIGNLVRRLKEIQSRFVFNKYLWLLIISAISLAAMLSLRPAEAANYYVQDYGAVGDGSTNDQAAIQAAIDDAASHGGGEVIFDGGRTYYTGNLFMRLR
jgi:polygalacturonase